MTSRARWHDTWTRLGAAPPSDDLYLSIVAGYAEPHRKYHTMQHLAECFANFDELQDAAEHPAEVELALWFHDAIYQTSKKDNEQRCADWARTAALAAGLAPDVADRVHALVMVTTHDAIPTTADARVMVDVDLGILGADVARYDEFERQVRAEYKWVPGLLFRRERRKVLQAFAEREHIYATDRFRRTREVQARANLAAALDRLN